MKILGRYIRSTIYVSSLMVLAIAIGLDTISRLIDEMGYVENDYDIAEVFVFVALTMPGRVVEYLPFSVLIGCMVGLGILANNSELVIIRSAGVGIRRIIIEVMKPVLVIVIIGVLVGEYAAPVTEKIAQSRQSFLQDGKEKSASNRGLWHREGREFMHFNAVQESGVLHGVTVYEIDENRLMKSALFAQRAYYNAEKEQWYMENVRKTVFQGNKTMLEETARLRWDTNLSPDLLSVVMLDADDLPIRGLWQYGRYLDKQELNSGEYWLAFWNKTLQPLTTISLILVAVSFIFGPLREVTTGYRIFIGVLTGIVFRTLQDLLAPASLVYGFEPIYAVVVPILICGGLGLFLLARVR